jgi:hypothetical protein
MTDMETEQGEEPEAMPDEGVAAKWMLRRRRPLMRRVGGRVSGHMEPRISFAVLTLSTLGFSAAVLLVIIGIAGAIVNAVSGDGMNAIGFLLAGLGLAVVAGAFGFAAGFIGLPFVGDWFLEWPNHAIAWSVGIAGCGLLALLLFLTPLPAYGDVILTLAAVFTTGYVLAYALRVTKPMPSRQRQSKK